MAKDSQTSILWARVEDAAEVAQMHAELFDPRWSETSITQVLLHAGSVSLLARTGQPAATVGFILGQVAADEAELISVGVSKNWQRRGIGRKLVQAMGRAAGNAGARRMYLEVGAGNAGALALYRSLGFEETGRRKAYYQRECLPAEDAVTMALTL